MSVDFNAERFNDENVKKAFAGVAAGQDFDLIRYALLKRYAEVRNLFPVTDGAVLNRAVGKLQEIEWVLEQFGERIFGGLPLADGTSALETAPEDAAFGAKIGGGYPGGTGSQSPL